MTTKTIIQSRKRRLKMIKADAMYSDAQTMLANFDRFFTKVNGLLMSYAMMDDYHNPRRVEDQIVDEIEAFFKPLQRWLSEPDAPDMVTDLEDAYLTLVNSVETDDPNQYQRKLTAVKPLLKELAAGKSLKSNWDTYATEPMMTPDGEVSSNYHYRGNRQQIAQVLEAMKPRQNSLYVNNFVVIRRGRNDWRVGEPSGDWLLGGTLDEVLDRIFKGATASFRSAVRADEGDEIDRLIEKSEKAGYPHARAWDHESVEHWETCLEIWGEMSSRAKQLYQELCKNRKVIFTYDNGKQMWLSYDTPIAVYSPAENGKPTGDARRFEGFMKNPAGMLEWMRTTEKEIVSLDRVKALRGKSDDFQRLVAEAEKLKYPHADTYPEHADVLANGLEVWKEMNTRQRQTYQQLVDNEGGVVELFNGNQLQVKYKFGMIDFRDVKNGEATSGWYGTAMEGAVMLMDWIIRADVKYIGRKL